MAPMPDSRESPGACALEPVRQDFRLVRPAIREWWPITDQIRQQVMDEAARIVPGGRTPALQLAAAKVLLAADLVNARREANRDEEHTQEARARVDALRLAMSSAMSSPEGRALLEQLNALTLSAASGSVPSPPPGGFISGPALSGGGEAPSVATPISEPPAKMA
jgi:hypothetical protein